MASPLTYADQQAWKDIQAFLPQRLHFTTEHSPTEEFWHHRGHILHLDRWRNPSAKIRLIMHHGVGTNGRQMSMLLGVPLHQAGFELVAIDMPGYGCTIPAKSCIWSFDEWVEISSAFINHELETDPRPIVLYGLSAGGALTYHAAALNKKVKGIVGMTFIDMRVQAVSDTTARNWVMSRIGVPLAKLLNSIGLGWLRMPMSLASKMSALVNNPKAMDVCLRDSSSAGAWVSMRFLASYSNYKPEVEPGEFTVCPVLLTQPTEDRWTPFSVSDGFLGRFKKVPVKVVELKGAGHYPLEDPGLQQMVDAIVEFLRELER